jgi:hypothetical protein
MVVVGMSKCKLCGAIVPSNFMKTKTISVFVNITHLGLNVKNRFIGLINIDLCRDCLHQKPKRIVNGELVFGGVK